MISEILIVGLGNRESRPHIFVILDQDLVIYEAFPFYTSATQSDQRLLVRFKKVRVAGLNKTHLNKILIELLCSLHVFGGKVLPDDQPHPVACTASGEIQLCNGNLNLDKLSVQCGVRSV